MTSPSATAWHPSELELARRATRRRQSTRSVLIALVSSVVFVVVVGWAILSSPGWEDVRRSFFDVDIAIAVFPAILTGLWVNIQVLIVAAIAAAILGITLAMLRSLRGPVFFPLRALATIYTDLFRGIPLLIVLYLVGFGLPALGVFGRVPAVLWGTVAIVLTYSAYIAEVLRAGMEAVHPSQRVAARSLGLTHGQTLRIVVIPQGVRKVVPALMNDFVSMQKDVGLISVLGGAVDAVRAAQIEAAQLYNFTPYIVAALLFVAMALPMIRLTDYVSARLAKREQMGGVV
ncbi:MULTISPECIES: amino acid ABC transporter permease [Microbacterium]|uniref:amino acid ABC transporter permease n=1 Tax=Microbacterium TaxID=33882 RepID=UPI00277D575E|nr:MULTISPECIES: amino acid ABC transporter permease [Microbacterium]MDQ1082277.1 polar amino acid transport system permease protein [Microbacterium sp. SORGH_AS_0344]MDQ1168951.1 polar amino acid transport system permease protein [Microbacterium proteolyticum]